LYYTPFFKKIKQKIRLLPRFMRPHKARRLVACACGFLIAVVVVAKQQKCNTKPATLLAALSLALARESKPLRVRLESVATKNQRR